MTSRAKKDLDRSAQPLFKRPWAKSSLLPLGDEGLDIKSKVFPSSHVGLHIKRAVCHKYAR